MIHPNRKATFVRRPALKSLIAVIAAGGIACSPTESQVFSVGENPDTLELRSQRDSVILRNADTTLVPTDTVIITRVDTLITVPDSLVVEVVDTVEVTVVDTVVEGSDTTFITSVDTVFATTVDTLVTVDTIVVTSVDTVVTVDTVIVADTVFVETELVAASNSQSLTDGLTIDSGQTATLTVTAKNSLDEASLPSSVTWLSDAPGTASVTDGAVLGVRPGNANIFAIADGLSATVPTTVQRVESTTVSEPLPEGSQSRFFRAHEPAGMTKIDDRPFSQLDEGWGFEFDGSPETIVSDSDAPHSPSGVIQFNYFEGQSGGGPLGNRGALFFPRSFDIVYIYLSWKIDPIWQGHKSLVNKQFFLAVTNPESGAGHQMIFDAHSLDLGRMRLRITGQRFCCDDPSPFFVGNVGSDDLTRGQWHEIEFVFTANTPGAADGRLEVWIDGVKSHDHNDFGPLTSAEGPGFNKILWSSIWGGTGDTVESDMWIRVDHMYVSGKN